MVDDEDSKDNTISEQRKKLQEAIWKRKQEGGKNLADFRNLSKEKIAQMKRIEESRKREEEIESEAFKIMDEAKKLADNSKFEDARGKYVLAIDSLKRSASDWDNQINIIREEISNLKEREAEQKERLERERKRKELQEQEFTETMLALRKKQEEKDRQKEEDRRAALQKKQEMEAEHYRQREATIRKEREKLVEIEEEKRKALDPVSKRKLDMADMTLKKAVRFERAGKRESALKRYEYLLELYRELDFSQEKVAEVEKKIRALKN